MYKNELDKHIASKSLANSLILFGESHFLIDTYITNLGFDSEASTLKLYYDEYDFALAKAHLSQASLFGDRNILIIKSDKKIPKKDLESLASLCEKNPSNLFLYGYYGDDFTTYKFALGKKFATMSVRFFHPKEGEAIALLHSRAREINLEIDGYTLKHLLLLQNGDIALAYSELDKLRLLGRLVTSKDCDQLVFGSGSSSVDDLLKALLSKKEYKTTLQNILDHSVNEVVLAGNIANYITRLFMFYIYIREHGRADASEILGYAPPQFVVDEYTRLALRLRADQYYNILELITKSTLDMKRSRSNASAVLHSMLIGISRII